MPMRKPHNGIQNGDTSLDKDSLHYRDTAPEQKLANDGEHEMLDDMEVNDSPLMNGIGTSLYVLWSTLSNGGISLHSAVKRKLVEDKDYVFDKRLRYNVRQNESNCRFRDIVVRKEEGFTHILLSSQTSDNNALTPEIMKEVRRALGNASVDDSKLLLLSAVGSVFCSGLDYSYLIGRLSSDRRKESTRIAESIRDFVKAFIQFKKPIVVAINGPALGLGASILPLCDVVWASEKAWFQTPCATIRLTPAGCSSYTFPQILGVALVSIGMKQFEDDAVWIRVAWGDNFTKPNQFKPTYVVYQLQTPYVFISNLNVKHRPLLSQALVIATKHDEIKEIQLRGRSLKSLKDLVLRRYKQACLKATQRALSSDTVALRWLHGESAVCKVGG
ncbi:UNVERIFIED_CONTAM: hypothetical protein FKN15_026247 [Acipenser sinensis]